MAIEVTVVRSPKRRKTAQARLVDGRLEVRIPARASKDEERRLVEVFRRRYERSTAAERIDVAARARALARRHDLPRPTEVRWVSNQSSRWGSCTPSTGVIRVSDRLAGFPTWVIDAVLVHELAHLVEADHGPAFHALVARYPLLERAEGYLIARSGSDSPTDDPLAGDLADDLDGEGGEAPETEAQAPGRPAADRRGPGQGELFG